MSWLSGLVDALKVRGSEHKGGGAQTQRFPRAHPLRTNLYMMRVEYSRAWLLRLASGGVLTGGRLAGRREQNDLGLEQLDGRPEGKGESVRRDP